MPKSTEMTSKHILADASDRHFDSRRFEIDTKLDVPEVFITGDLLAFCHAGIAGITIADSVVFAQKIGRFINVVYVGRRPGD